MSSKPKNREKKQRKNKNKKLETSKDKKERRTHIIKEVTSYIIIILVAVLIASHLNVVVSGSMEPSFYRGDIVAIQNTHTFYGTSELDPYNDVHIGDVVIYNATWYSEPVIHRVIAEGYDDNGTKYFEIKGDNNDSPDPYWVSPDQITGKVITIGDNLFVIPKIGYITLFVRGI